MLHQNNGARFVVIKRDLDVNADSLTRNLQFLIDGGWVQRNPGYGHPLRPEYLLTDKGQSIAAQCSKLVAAGHRLKVTETIFHKWSIPLLVTVKTGTYRFNELRQTLEITPRALTQALQRLCASDLLAQQLEYRLTPSGIRIATVAHRLGNFPRR